MTVAELLNAQGYIPDASVSMSFHFSMLLHNPLLIEDLASRLNEIAKVLIQGLNIELIRLQCYEGLDAVRRCICLRV